MNEKDKRPDSLLENSVGGEKGEFQALNSDLETLDKKYKNKSHGTNKPNKNRNKNKNRNRNKNRNKNNNQQGQPPAS